MIRILPLSSLISLIFASIIKPGGGTYIDSTTYTLDRITIEPLMLNNNTNIVISGSGSKTNATKVTISIINDFYPNGIQITKQTFATTTTKTFVYSNEYTRLTKNKLHIEGIADGKLVVDVIKDIDVINGNSIIIPESGVYTSKAKGLCYTPNNGWSYENQIITFNNFNGIYTPDYYHKFDPGELFLSVESKFYKALAFKKVSFIISNLDGVFNSITNDEYLNLELSPVVFNAGLNYKFAFKTPLYVNQRTLEMAITPKDGFVKTKYFYLPINQMKSQENYKCYLMFVGLGVDKSNCIYEFKIRALINSIGDCRTSEYCILNKE